MSLNLIDLVEPLGLRIPTREEWEALNEKAMDAFGELNDNEDDDAEERLEERYEAAERRQERVSEALQAWERAEAAFTDAYNRLTDL